MPRPALRLLALVDGKAAVASARRSGCLRSSIAVLQSPALRLPALPITVPQSPGPRSPALTDRCTALRCDCLRCDRLPSPIAMPHSPAPRLPAPDDHCTVVACTAIACTRRWSRSRPQVHGYAAVTCIAVTCARQSPCRIRPHHSCLGSPITVPRSPALRSTAHADRDTAAARTTAAYPHRSPCHGHRCCDYPHSRPPQCQRNPRTAPRPPETLTQAANQTPPTYPN